MFNLGFSELVLLAVIALIFIGPKQLPEVAKTLARVLNELRRATGDIAGTFRDVGEKATQEIRRGEDAIRKPSHPAKPSHATQAQEHQQIEDADFEELTHGGVGAETQVVADTEVNFDPNATDKEKSKG